MDAVGEMAPDRRRIVVTIECTTLEARLVLRDHGCGLPPAVLASLFEPFTTTKPDGMGIGLALSQRIAAAHEGTIDGANNPDGGAIFRLTLPLAAASAPASV